MLPRNRRRHGSSKGGLRSFSKLSKLSRNSSETTESFFTESTYKVPSNQAGDRSIIENLDEKSQETITASTD
jgi:hypothetical protein